MATTPALTYHELAELAQPLGIVVDSPYENDSTTFHLIGKAMVIELLVGAHPTSCKAELKKFHRYGIKRGSPFIHPENGEWISRSWKYTKDVMDAIRAAAYCPPRHDTGAYTATDQRFILMQIYSAQHGQCAYCEKSMPFKAGSLDHIIPYSRGGIDNPSNWCFSCVPCNSAKGSMTATEFRSLKTTGV